jgi:RHS repeat-associated protein
VPNFYSTRYEYTGQLNIPELNLFDFKARAYDPNLGRFLSADPAGYASDINSYAYVGNDPVNGNDPSGMGSNCDSGNSQCPDLSSAADPTWLTLPPIYPPALKGCPPTATCGSPGSMADITYAPGSTPTVDLGGTTFREVAVTAQRRTNCNPETEYCGSLETSVIPGPVKLLFELFRLAASQSAWTTGHLEKLPFETSPRREPVPIVRQMPASTRNSGASPPRPPPPPPPPAPVPLPGEAVDPTTGIPVSASPRPCDEPLCD